MQAPADKPNFGGRRMADEAASPGAEPATADDEPGLPILDLPAVLLDELLALAEIGHLAGLRDALQRAEQDRRLPPSLVGTLQAPLERFDFQALIKLLEQTP